MSQDLVDRIETTRFLGGEFLLWLWYCQDAVDGDIELAELGTVDVSIQSQLSLVDPVSSSESVTVKGALPCLSTEAEQALRCGKLPRKATLRLCYQEAEWLVTLDAQTLALSSIRLPALLAEEEEARLLERLALLEQLDQLVLGLYQRFLQIRLSPLWTKELLPNMRSWVSSGHQAHPTSKLKNAAQPKNAGAPRSERRTPVKLGRQAPQGGDP